MSALPAPLEVTLNGANLTSVAVVAAIAVVAMIMAMVFRREVLAANDGTTNMRAIALGVQEGAAAYLRRQFRTLSVFAVAELPTEIGGGTFLDTQGDGAHIRRTVV